LISAGIAIAWTVSTGYTNRDPVSAINKNKDLTNFDMTRLTICQPDWLVKKSTFKMKTSNENSLRPVSLLAHQRLFPKFPGISDQFQGLSHRIRKNAGQ
jgi:hypothetical protein